MSNVTFSVPKLTDNNAWLDYRNQFPGGFGWRYDRSLSNIRYAANHHSVTNPSGNALQDVQTLWNIHKNNGWGGIGYNFVITSEVVKGKDGLDYAKVAYVGDIGSVRAHTTNARGVMGLKAGFGNEYIVAACMIGQLHINNPSAAQLRSAYWLYRELIQEEPDRLPNLRGSLNDKLTSHKTWDYTECSGNWDYQKGQIVNYKDPQTITSKTTSFNPKKFRVTATTSLVNIPAGSRYPNSRDYTQGETIEDVVELIEYSDGKKFYRTKYARDTAQKMYGFFADKLAEIKVPVITKSDVTLTKVLPFETNTVEDNTLPKGETKVITEGSDGTLTTVYEVTYTDGVETSRKLKSENVTKHPVTKEVRVGSYVAPSEPVNPIDPVPGESANNWLQRIIKWIGEWLSQFIFKGK